FDDTITALLLHRPTATCSTATCSTATCSTVTIDCFTATVDCKLFNEVAAPGNVMVPLDGNGFMSFFRLGGFEHDEWPFCGGGDSGHGGGGGWHVVVAAA
nr:hypothetical protein [Tanacetum cinerariifolium]